MALSPNSRYVVRRDGKDYGPYDAATLSRYVAEGSIDGDDLVRPESGATWTTIAELMPGTTAPPPVPPVPGRPTVPPVMPLPQVPGLPAVSYVGGVLVTIFCCQITGPIALVHTGLANTAAARGDAAAYASNRRLAIIWTWVSVGLVLLSCIAGALVQAALGAMLEGMGGPNLGR